MAQSYCAKPNAEKKTTTKNVHIFIISFVDFAVFFFIIILLNVLPVYVIVFYEPCIKNDSISAE